MKALSRKSSTEFNFPGSHDTACRRKIFGNTEPARASQNRATIIGQSKAQKMASQFNNQQIQSSTSIAIFHLISKMINRRERKPNPYKLLGNFRVIVRLQSSTEEKIFKMNFICCSSRKWVLGKIKNFRVYMFMLTWNFAHNFLYACNLPRNHLCFLIEMSSMYENLDWLKLLRSNNFIFRTWGTF